MWKTRQFFPQKIILSLVKRKVPLNYTGISSIHCGKSVVNINFPQLFWHLKLNLREAFRMFVLTLNVWIIGTTLVFLIASFLSRFTEYILIDIIYFKLLEQLMSAIWVVSYKSKYVDDFSCAIDFHSVSWLCLIYALRQ